MTEQPEVEAGAEEKYEPSRPLVMPREYFTEAIGESFDKGAVVALDGVIKMINELRGNPAYQKTLRKRNVAATLSTVETMVSQLAEMTKAGGFSDRAGEPLAEGD